MQPSWERYSASRWDVIKSLMLFGCLSRFASHELRRSDTAPWTRRPCLPLPMARTRSNAMQSFVRVRTTRCSSGSGRMMPSKVVEGRGKGF